MPSFSCPSSIRVASQDHALRLKITHSLVHELPSETIYSIKGRLPKELDVLWLSDIVVSFSGSLDGRQIAAHDIARSGLVHHLETRLKANADQLGLNNVSRPFVDDTDGLSKLTLTPSRPLPHASRPHANLVSLHLAFIWRTIEGYNDAANSRRLVEEMNPFSPTLFLPAEALLNRAIEQFLIYHFVGRYPLIFGPWCKRLDLEMQYFPSISRSIVEIMARSENQNLLLKCRRLIKIARRHHKFILQSSAVALSSFTDNAPETSVETLEGETEIPVLTKEQILCESLEQLFRVGVPRRRFKPAATLSLPQDDDDDDDLLPFIPMAGTDDKTSWIELPEITVSPHVDQVESAKLFSDDMDVFAEEDWLEDGEWNIHDTDMILDECEIGAQSDESLIGTSVPLTCITTRPTQACTFTLYHHLDVDDHEPDPAASGLNCSLHLEEPGPRDPFAALTYGTHDRQTCEQLMVDPDPWQAESEGFETGVVCSDWILSDVEGDIDALRQSPGAIGMTEWDLEDWM